MKNFKLLSVIVIAGLLLAGCEKIDNAADNNDNSDSTIIQSESQSNITKTESSDSDTVSTESITYDKATIEKKVKEIKGIIEDSIKDMKWSPDGKELVFVIEDEQQNCDVYLWELGKKQPKKANINIFGGITSFGWSPNSEYVLVDNGTSAIRTVMLINKYGDGEIWSFNTSGFAHSNVELEQLWSEDSTKIAIAKYNDEIEALPDMEVSGVFDIVVYDVNSMTEKTILKSTATEYYTIEKWVDNDTISCNKYAPQNGELGSIVEQKDIKIS